MNLKKYFKSKKIIYTGKFSPGELVKVFQYRGKKFVRIAFSNKVKIKGMVPVTDVPFDQVTAIRKLPTPFKKKMYSLAGLKAKAKFYQIQK